MDAIFADESLRTSPALPSRYRIEAMCGSGGAGTVYRAWDHELGRTIALKVLRDDRPQHRDRMLREARAQARIDHPNVCKVFDSGAEGDRLYIAMQWIDGERLDSIAAELSLEKKAAVIRDVADGVHAAHAKSVIHRDLKPANILVERLDGGLLHPYIVDFGLARAGEDAAMTATGEVVGTPYYLAPEQAWGLPVDRRSDVYSLGATLFELLAGRPPFAGDTTAEVMLQVISRPAPPVRTFLPSIPRDLAVITEKCLAKEPERRYDSARALRDDLARWLAGEPIAARPPSLGYRAWSFVRRHRAVAAAIVAASLTIGGVAGYRIAQLQREREQGQLAAELENRVRYIERFLEYDRALPLHDGRPAVARARSEIRALSAPARFDGPKKYAVGRAELAVGDDTAAHESLQTAWRENFRTPAVAYYLAVAMSAEYARELATADRVQDTMMRRSRIAAIDARYREAVLPLLDSARAFAEQPSLLIESRIAAARGEGSRTESLLQKTLERFPWNNEARLLEAELRVRDARAKRFAGQIAAASAAFDAAARIYERAVVIAPSDARLRDGLCQIAVDRMQVAGPFNTQITTQDDALFARARTACEQALLADPDHVSSLAALSSAWALRSVQQRLHGDASTSADFQHAIDFLDHALRLAPNDAAVLEQAGLTWWRLGYGGAWRAIPYLRRAVALNPRSADTRHSLGRALLGRHDEIEVSGGDSLSVLREAEQQYHEAIRLAPDFVGAQSNLAITLNHLGNYFSFRGVDPEPYYRQAIAILEPLIAKHPTLGEPQSICAWSWFEIARHRLETGADPSADLAASERYYTAALALNPGYTGDHASRSGVYIKEAELATDDAVREERLRRADEDLRFVEAHGTDARRAEWYEIKAISARTKREATAAIDHADAIVAEVIRTQSYPDGGIWILRGRMQRFRCALSLPGCDPAQSEASFRHALELNPTVGYSIAALCRQDDALLNRSRDHHPSG